MNASVDGSVRPFVSKGMSMSACAKVANHVTTMIDNIKAARVTISVSPRNWMMRIFLELPRLFRIPTSFARRTACAVARFVKLMLAMTRITNPITIRMFIAR